ncbi:FRAS1-related extracellular matrix protein 1b [Salvelinus alpinus]|uniref:FRAS1-related extracellular matrix protein 1b n=1 Tax=Salvelinus alpinus TaxID=8036 RepID=UPI0039FD1C1D
MAVAGVHSWMLLTLMAVLPHACAQQSLVRVNSGVQVGRGRSVFVTDKELQFNVDQTSDCKVEVVLNEPVTQRVGKLTPQVFDCHFLPDEVKYIHNGSPLLEEDTVMLRVYRFTVSDTLVETVVLRMIVVEPESSLVELGSTPLVVPQFYGLSNAIDGGVLSIRSQPDVACTVRLLTPETSVPSLGQLVTEEDPGLRKGRQTGDPCPGNKPCLHSTKEVRFLKATCHEFLSLALKYQHLSPPSPEIDYIPIRVELRDQASRALLETEAVWLPVLIHGAMQNQPPQAAFMASFILEADQFILTPLTTATLDAKDGETPQERLVFNVTKPPAQGYIAHLDDHTKTCHSFIWQDLHEMKIAYQPPNSSHTGRRNYEVEFQAIDGSYVASPPIMVHFSIRAAETNAPRVSWNMGLDLLEGQSRPITWEDLQIVDSDNIDAVYLVAVDGPLHGRLSVRGGKGFMFRIRDLQEGVVVYHHSDSDTTRDHIVFRITDGRHSIRHKFPINILPKDDTAPFLINNVALEVQEGGEVLVEEYMLLASDLDSSDDYILYQLLTFPRAGEVVKKAHPQQPGVPVKSFLQRDLFMGLIYYRHSGEESFEDTFDFTLSDSHQPPNLSHRHTVVIHVFPVKDQLPVEVSGSVRSVTVRETDVVYLTQSHIHFRDTEHPDTDLSFFITTPCFSPTRPGLPDAGRLFYTDSTHSMKKDPMVPVLKSFTQHAVNHMKVGYMPPIEDIGPEPLFVQFLFSVSDHHGGTTTDLLFNVTVTPVDNQAPEVFTNLLRVEEGGGAFFTEEHLLVRDGDSLEDKLRVGVQTTPIHGKLELQGRELRQGDTFILQDLRGLRVRYIHDDSETVEDTVGLTVTDGVNSAHVFLPVQILPVNDEPPQLGPGLRGGLTCEEGGLVQVTAEYLFATDADSDDARLIYMLARTPARGELQRGGVTVDKFSQQDILQGLIYYIHTGGEIGASPVSDSVTLIVSDGEAGGMDSCCHGDALPPPVPLHGTLPVYDLNVTVLPVNNKAPVITMGDMFVVDEGSSACLCGGVLGAEDPDTYPEELLFLLENPPLQGFLENTLPSPGFEKSNAGLRVVSFSLLHLRAGYINYVQAEHQGTEPTVDQLVISVSDGRHKSPPIPFYIIIHPTNDETPSLTLSNFTVIEGGIKELSPAILNALDLDAPADILTFTVLVPPAHGTLLNGIYGTELSRYKNMGPKLLLQSLMVRTFTMEELKQGMRIMYMHDDTETLKDSFTVQLTDGRHTIQGTAHLRVLPVNDEKPRLLKNAGVEVDWMDRRVISSVVLEAEDLDTPTSKLYYILNAGPRFGKLQVKTEAGWTDIGAGQNFTQEDVEFNRLWYAHTTGTGFKGHDSIRFTLSDLDNESPPQSFFISVRTIQKGDIVLVTRPVTLMEGERLILTTDILLATDGAARPGEVLYTVSIPPKHGHVHAVQRPGMPFLRFSQLDVAAQRVCYTHDNSHTAEHDSFSFVVTNGISSRSGSLHFTIEHSDRIPPSLNRNTGLQLTEGAVKSITPNHLELTDPDTAVGNLTYALTQPPQYGKLLLKGYPLTLPRFTQTDINNMDLAYQHYQGSLAQIDRFSLMPSDGTNRGYLEYGQLKEEPLVFTIQVEHVDRNPPSLVTKRIPSTVENLSGGPGDKQGIYITSRDLQASDPDSLAQELEFTITRPPHFGYLENSLTGAYIKGRFTQRDLEQRAVLYVIPTDMEVTGDSFEFRVTDPAGNTMLPEILQLTWSRVELSATCYRVCENAGMLQVQLTRSGKSMDPAYIAIQVEDGTAKVGKDFTHSTASLIQFDPGVNVKTWNIYLKDDGLEENHETFTVILKGPKNTVLGQRNSASVEIVDPRGGMCDPEDLRVEEDEKGVPSTAHVPQSPQLEEHGTDFETDLLWESRPHPPRGDVPNRRPFLDYGDGEGEPQDQATQFHSQATRQLRLQGGSNSNSNSRTVLHSGVRRKSEEKVWTFHALTPLRLEERRLPIPEPIPQVHPDLQVIPIWSWSGHRKFLHEVRVGDAPQDDAPVPSPKQHRAGRQRKAGRSVSTSCPTGWSHYRRHCYILSPGVASWSSAQRACTLLFDSNLTSVQSKKDMAWLWKFAGKQAFWIGLSGSPGHWTWMDGRSMSFSRLKRDRAQEQRPESAASRSTCVLAQSQKTWTPMTCTTAPERRYICSSPAQNH